MDVQVHDMIRQYGVKGVVREVAATAIKVWWDEPSLPRGEKRPIWLERPLVGVEVLAR